MLPRLWFTRFAKSAPELEPLGLVGLDAEAVEAIEAVVFAVTLDELCFVDEPRLDMVFSHSRPLASPTVAT